jgi:hypothetical protein
MTLRIVNPQLSVKEVRMKRFRTAMIRQSLGFCLHWMDRQAVLTEIPNPTELTRPDKRCFSQRTAREDLDGVRSAMRGNLIDVIIVGGVGGVF